MKLKRFRLGRVTKRFVRFTAGAFVMLVGASGLRGESLSVTPATDGLIIHRDRAVIQLQVWDDRIIRVRYSASGKLTAPAVSAVIATLPAAKFVTLDTSAYVGVKTGAVEVRVDRATAAVSFVDAGSGKTFLAEAPNGRSITSATVDQQVIHGPGQAFVRQPGEAIIGLGQHQEGQFNYSGGVQLLQQNTEIAIPVETSSAGFTLLWDNASVTNVDAGESSVTWSSEDGETTDYYVCYGPDLNLAIAGYRKLTGDAPMFGRWAWGLWQSRERYVTQEELLATAREYRRRQIPIDGIVQDWQYWYPNPWGSHAFGTNFPDPGGAVKELHAAHFHTLISVWAKFDEGSKNFDEMEAAGNLYPQVYPNVYPAGKAKWYDAFKPQARAMYWRQMNEEIGKYGWDGWWLDATEPELSGKWGEMRSLHTAAGPGYAVFNAYPLMTTTAVYQGQRAREPHVRPFILTRSAYAGQQRNGAVSWSGDVVGSWEVFKKQVPAGLNFVASGIPYWNTDTGGFFGGDPSDEGYRELFTRWFQFSTFCPMLRVHGTGAHKTLWAFGDKTDAVLLQFDRLRYRLIPYIYSTSWQVTAHHASMMRPLMMDYHEDPATYTIGDQFMFGPRLMACPVTEPIGGSLAVVPPASLISSDGKGGGLSATYYQGEHFEKEVCRRVDGTIDFDWDKVKREGVGANPRVDPVPGLTMDGFSARWEGFIQTQGAGSYRFQLSADDGMRLWVNGNLLVDDWKARKLATRLATIELPAETRVPIKIEYFQNVATARIELRWQPPVAKQKGPFTRKVYLPAGQWFDFWTGEIIAGGKTIDAPAPIERLPVFVKAGAILPMGAEVQYTGEKPEAPLELRVYRGADGTFSVYDDAGDGYGDERGEYSKIPLTWDERSGTLTIGARTGQFPGMAARRQFRVVLVNGGQGAGVEPAGKPDAIIDYDGSEKVVRLGAPASTSEAPASAKPPR